MTVLPGRSSRRIPARQRMSDAGDKGVRRSTCVLLPRRCYTISNVVSRTCVPAVIHNNATARHFDRIQGVLGTSFDGRVYQRATDTPGAWTGRVWSMPWRLRSSTRADVADHPAWNAGYLGVKVVDVFPGNAARGRPTVTGTYLLMGGGTGEPLALLDAHELTARRTAGHTRTVWKAGRRKIDDDNGESLRLQHHGAGDRL